MSLMFSKNPRRDQRRNQNSLTERQKDFFFVRKFNTGISGIDRWNFIRHPCAPKINVGLKVGINFADRKKVRERWNGVSTIRNKST